MNRSLYVLIIIVFCSSSLLSFDGPNVWTLTYNNQGRIYTMAIDPVNQNIMYEAGLDSGIYKTTNAGLNWLQINTGLTYNKVQCISVSPSNPLVLYAGTDQLGTTNSGVYKSTNGGTSWTLMSNGITDSKGIQQIAIHPTNPNIAWAAVFDGVAVSTVGVWKTTDGGNNWFASSTGIDMKNILSIIVNPVNPNVLYAGSSFNSASPTSTKIYKSFDGGNSWASFSNGLPTGATTGNPIRVLSMSTIDTARILASLFNNDTTGGAYLTTNGGLNWVKKHGLPNIAGTLQRAALIKPGSNTEFFVGLDGGGATTRGVWRTTDAGATWADFNGGALLNTFTIRALVFRTIGSPTLYAGAATTTPATSRGVYEYSWPAPVAIAPDLLYYKFENNPSATTVLNCAFPGVGVNPAPLTGHTLGTGGQFDSCIIGTGATNSGVATGWATNLASGSWTISMWLNEIPVNTSLYYLFGESAGSFRCFLGGAAGAGNITLRGTGITTVDVAAVGPGPTVVHFVYDSALSQIRAYKNGTLSNTVTQVPLNLSQGTGFKVGAYSTSAGLNGKMDEFRMYRRALTAAEISATYNVDIACAIVVGQNNNNNNVPAVFSLEQNYPNPFNPTTKITYNLPKASQVTLVVYDLLGREVTTLINDFVQAGSHTFDFNASALASGVYLYKITAGSFTDTKKMLLIK